MANEAAAGPAITANELRVLVLPPTTADGVAMRKVLGSNSISTEICSSLKHLCAQHREGAGVLIVSEEAVSAGAEELLACVTDQPVWSDLPVMVLSTSRGESSALSETLVHLGNATVIERPIRTSTLVSLVRSGLRARERQYQVREHIAQQEHAQLEIRRADRRYRSLIENITDYAIFVTDGDGLISSWNSGAETMLGFSASEVLGQPMRLFDAEGDESGGDRWIRRKDGDTLYIESTSAPLTSEAGQPEGVAHFLKDVTDRHRIATEREELLESERAARGEAERASRMKEEFLATLSHELRTPLNAVLGWTRLLRKSRGLPEEAINGLTVIERNAKSQAQIIEDLLDMSSIISGKVRLDLQPLELSTVVAATLETIKPTAEAKGVELRLELDPGSSLIRGDQFRLQQVLWNLLTNAVKFTPRGGVITIALARLDSQLAVEVTDNGEGIDPEFLPQVFDRFRQADASSTRKHGGLGLGLSIVKQLVELHGGAISAASSGAGQGSTFRIVLPLLAVAPESRGLAFWRERRERVADPKAEEASRQDLDGLRVLVLDDEPDARSLMQRILEECKASVTVVGSAAEAMEVLQSQPQDVMVSDIGMPGEDGYSLIRRVRSMEGANAGIPAIALTAYARAEDRAKAINAGFQMHLSKPVDAGELIATIHNLAQQPVT